MTPVAERIALYLDGRRPLSVCLDGPALRVSGPGQADGRYPLRRLSRVVASGHVDWRTNALLACMQGGVPVTFLDVDGRPFGSCLGHLLRPLALADRLRELLARPDWRELYGNWFAATERRQILRVLRRLRRNPRDLRRQAVQDMLLRGHLRVGTPTQVHRAHELLRGLLCGLVPEILDRAGLTPLLAEARAHGLSLPGDLARLLEWELHFTIHRAARLPLDEHWRRACVAAFEADVPELRRRGALCMAALENWLAEVFP